MSTAYPLDCTAAAWQDTGIVLSGEIMEFESSGSYYFNNGLGASLGLSYSEGSYPSNGVVRRTYDPSAVQQITPDLVGNPYPNNRMPPTCLLLLFKPDGDPTPALTPQPLSVSPNEGKRYWPSDYWEAAGTTGDVRVWATVNTYFFGDNTGTLNLTFTLTELGNDRVLIGLPGYKTQQDLDNGVFCGRTGILTPRNLVVKDGTGLLVWKKVALQSGPRD